MYSTCLFCKASLGTNQSIEAFPVGRRLAFDAEKGRLWVVCSRCARWNLTPVEERWEAIEECERCYRQTRLRVATENIGLARLKEGTELVRIGKPLRPEFAAWRYGAQLGRRRMRAGVGVGIGFLAFMGISAGSAIITGGGAAAVGVVGGIGLHLYTAARAAKAGPVRIRTAEGELLSLPAFWAGGTRLQGAGNGPDDWQLLVPSPARTIVLEGGPAVAAALQLLPHANRTGATRGEVEEAVREIEGVGEPLDYFAQAELRARKRGYGYGPLAQLPKPIRLALEMAANEQTERQALEGEISLLEQAWRDAEEIAGIADGLLLAPGTEAVPRHQRHPERRPAV